MVLHALSCMKDNGRAAIIIGGWTDFENDETTFNMQQMYEAMKRGKDYKDNAMIKASRPFFNYLYKHYKVVDCINIDSQALYHKQGTSYPLRMILIAGRKELPNIDNAPTYIDAPEIVKIEDDFSDLFDRVQKARTKAANYTSKTAAEWCSLFSTQLKIAQ